MLHLSKYKILAYRQCPKRLWLEIHQPDLRDDSASAAVFAIGNQVGEIARRLFDPDQTGVTLDIGELGHAEALARSAILLTEGKGPVFEAGLTAAGALAYWARIARERCWHPSQRLEDLAPDRVRVHFRLSELVEVKS